MKHRILRNETYLYGISCYRMAWTYGMVTLESARQIFPDSVTLAGGRRTIFRQPIDGFVMLNADRLQQLSIINTNRGFGKKFDSNTHGLLRNLNWDNIFVAGGIIVGTLLEQDINVCGSQWASSDVDIFLYGLSRDDAEQKIRHIYDTYCANLPHNESPLVVRNANTITFYTRYPLHRIQIILKLLSSPRAILLRFDLDICAMGWDGKVLWMLPRAARALESK